MYSVTKVINFCYGHRLLDYRGKCRRLHGHNGKLEITIRKRSLNKNSMVMDFDKIKESIQKWVDSKLDHRMILNRKDPLARTLRRTGEPIVLVDGNPTAETIARLVYVHAGRQGLPVSEVRLWETPTSFAVYTPEKQGGNHGTL